MIIIVLGWLGLLMVQWLTPNIWGADGYYHIGLAKMVKQQGLLKSLPQAQWSYFIDRFSNKDWLYHLGLLPFTGFSSLVTGAKWAAWVGGGILYTSLVMVASNYVVPALLPLVGLAVFLSNHFLMTLSRPRPMVLAIALGLWAVHWLLEKKKKQLLITTLIYSWLHITAVLVLVYGLVVKIYRLMFGRKMSWRLIGVIVLGWLIGMVVYPNFPNNWFFFYLNGMLVPFLAAKTKVLELGAEFFPINTRDYLLSYPLTIVGLLTMVWISILDRPRIKLKTQIMFLLGAMFIFMGFWSQRYIAHGYPFMILGLTMFLSDWYEGEGIKRLAKKIKKWINVLMTAGVMLVLVLLANSLQRLMPRARGNTLMNSHYEAMGQWLRENTEEGEIVFTANWSDPQYFIGLSPKNNYLVTMDPVYMWHKNQQAYDLYRAAAFGRLEDPYPALKEVFKASYGYAGKNYFSGLINQVREDERFKIVKEDQMGVIFKILD